jgi:hypothetical protein
LPTLRRPHNVNNCASPVSHRRCSDANSSVRLRNRLGAMAGRYQDITYVTISFVGCGWM